MLGCFLMIASLFTCISAFLSGVEEDIAWKTGRSGHPFAVLIKYGISFLLFSQAVKAFIPAV